jgi:hypothetical protein
MVRMVTGHESSPNIACMRRRRGVVRGREERGREERG